MSWQIQMVGTGSAFAKKYYNTSALILKDQVKVLIDCGYSTPQGLHALGVTPDQLDGIVISHIHADHVFGLEEIGFRLFYNYNKKRMKLFLTEPIARVLWEETLQGSMYNSAENCVQLTDYFDVVILKEYEKTTLFPGIDIEMIPTLHVPSKNSYSLFINEQTFYSADLQFNRELILDEIIGRRKCHTLLHDCQLSGPPIIHASLQQLLTLPQDVQEKIWLMHYDDRMEQFIGQTGHMSFILQQQIVTLPE
ncbi:MBL fold metallo-hydrolase [Paenibacillus hexagrammi]|uniref:MBL fold metallo-hydrolase n=1 Tax=Paenibacillus hexagrammi TaxID=2908839 RepID=A0ABY3SPN0_9BACL|nr:MBL fold metallo-hydrolase [Paenibacillus sp. YPD9-1]UJF35214.1 MBL fold metallo-hydrolase [Paenibacillus sp. YPD9-1]